MAEVKSVNTPSMKLQVGVKLLIKNSANQYLFIKRKEALPDGSGIRWDIPGGRIKSSETLLHALAREVREEVGIELAAEPVLLDAQDIIVPNIELHVIRLTYQVDMEGVSNLGNEHSTCTWASLMDAHQLHVDDYLHKTLQGLELRSS